MKPKHIADKIFGGFWYVENQKNDGPAFIYQRHDDLSNEKCIGTALTKENAEKIAYEANELIYKFIEFFYYIEEKDDSLTDKYYYGERKQQTGERG